MPRGWRWSSSSHAREPQRRPCSSTQLHCSPSRATTARRVALLTCSRRRDRTSLSDEAEGDPSIDTAGKALAASPGSRSPLSPIAGATVAAGAHVVLSSDDRATGATRAYASLSQDGAGSATQDDGATGTPAAHGSLPKDAAADAATEDGEPPREGRTISRCAPNGAGGVET